MDASEEQKLAKLRADNESLREELHQTHDLLAALQHQLGGQTRPVDLIEHERTTLELERLLLENRTQREFLDQLIQNATIGVAVVRGLECRYELVNPAYLRLLGQTQDNLTGRTMDEMLSPHLAAGEKWLIQSVYQSNKVMAVREYEARLGEERSETYWDVDHIPLHDHQGRVDRVLILAREVTEDVLKRRRIQLSMDMELSTHTLSTLIDIMPAAIVVSDAKGTIVMENDAARKLMRGPMTGTAYTPGGRYEMRHVNGQPFPLNELPLARALNEGRSTDEIEILFHFYDGQETVALARGSPVFDEHKNLVGAAIVMQDITERKQEEREREQRLYGMSSLIERSYEIIGERSEERLLQRTVEIARELTGARLATLGNVLRNGSFTQGAVSCAQDARGCPEVPGFAFEQARPYMNLIRNRRTLRLSKLELARNGGWGLPEARQLEGLVGAPLVDHEGHVQGVLLVSDKTEGEFTRDDEGLLAQLATLASLALQHIHARLKIEEHARLLERIFGSLTDVVMVYDTADNIIMANEAAHRRYGVDPTRYRRPELASVIRPQHRDGTLPRPEELPSFRALQGETVTDDVYVQDLPDGRRMVVAISAAPLLSDGQVQGAVAVWHDITEREGLIEELERQRGLLQAVFESQGDAILVYDAEGNLLTSNARVQEQYGVQPTGVTRYDLVRALQARHSDGTPYELDDLPGSRAQRGENVLDELVYCTLPDGRSVVIATTATPLRSNGNIWGTVVVWHNVTERQELLAQLDNERRLLKAVFAAQADVLLVYDREGNVILTNPAAQKTYGIDLLGVTPQLAAATLSPRHPDGSLVTLEQLPSIRALRGETVLDETIAVQTPTGEQKVISNSAAPMLDETGAVRGAVAVWRDITERQELANHLDRQRQLLEAIFSALTDTVVVYDENGQVIMANDASERYHGFRLAGWRQADLAREIQTRNLDGTPLEPAMTPSARALRGEVVTDLPMQIRLRDRDYVISVSAAPLLSKEKVLGAVSAWHDITQQVALTEQLSREQHLLEEVLRQIPLAILIVEAPSGRIILSNRANTLIWGEEIAAERMQDYARYKGFHTDGSPYQPEDWPLARAVMHGEVIKSERIDIVAADGQHRAISVSATPVHDEQNRVVAAVAIYSTINENKESTPEDG